MIVKQVEVTGKEEEKFAEQLEAALVEVLGKDGTYFAIVGFKDERVELSQEMAAAGVQSTGIRAISNMSPTERALAIAACLRGDPVTYAEYIRIVMLDALSTKTGRKMMDEFIRNVSQEGDGRAN